MDENLSEFPENLPQPKDDGTCDHLLGKMTPEILLPSTSGDSLDACTVYTKFVIMYFFQ